MSTLPSLTFQQKIDRRDEKHSAILKFLGSFEVFSTIELFSILLNTSESSARRACMQLVREKLLIEEKHFVDGHQKAIFGISAAGLVFADAHPNAPYFERGRVGSQFIKHKLDTQRIRITCEQIGGVWQSERQIRIQFPSLKKIPDGLCRIELSDSNLAGDKVMIEIEREVKTSKRYQEIIRNHLFSIEAEEFAHAVLYLFPRRYVTGGIRLLSSISQPECVQRDELPRYRSYRVMVGTLEDFPLNIHFLHGGEVSFIPCIFP